MYGLESILVSDGNVKYHSNGNCLIETDAKILILGCKNSTIPSDGSVTSIGNSAFYGCVGLTSITIPDRVTGIGEGAFSDCRGLTSVTIGNGVANIGDGAFNDCDKLVEIVNNSNLDIVKGSEEYGCVALYALNVQKGGTTEIVNKDGYLFYTSDNVNYLLGYVGNDTELTLLNNYNGQNYQIYKYAFYKCHRLSRIIISNKVTCIGDYAFEDCCNLTSITIGNGVTSIGDGAFYECSGLASITIGNGVTNIGYEAFYECSRLASITIGSSVTSIGYKAFYGCNGLEHIIVSDGNAEYHSNGNCLIETEAKNLILGCKNSTIPSDGSVTSIGDLAFYGCNGLTGKLIIPDSVTSIGDLAFYGCNGLTGKMIIPDSVISIGRDAFKDCSNLMSITIGNGVSRIGEGVFSGCSGLTDVTIGENVSYINCFTFYGCTSLENVEFKDTTTWFKASSYIDMDNGNWELVDVSNSANNAKIISDCYWYKI